MHQRLLFFIVFIAGAIVMIFEIAGARLLAPYIGTSMYIWTSIIGVILASLSIGYAVGGRLADQKPTHTVLSGILGIAALFIGLSIFFSEPIIRILSLFSDLRIRAVCTSLFLFAPASTCLGMVSPYAARLCLHTLTHSGRTIGNLYAISTIGSIAGTFFAGFFLLPLFGVRIILFLLCITLLMLSLLVGKPWRLCKLGGILFFLLTMQIPSAPAMSSNIIAERDSLYGHITLIQDTHIPTGRPVLQMKINNESSSAMFLDGDELVYDYTKFYRLVHHFSPHVETALMLGGAAYSYPKNFLQSFPNATLDVVEIDPVVTELAYTYFSLPKQDSRLHIFHEDGRTFLQRSHAQYDVIFNDAYSSLYSIPYHLTTKEAVELMYHSLTPNGVVFTNIISSIEGDTGKFLRAEYATYAAVFPHVFVFPVRDSEDGNKKQNIVLFASKSSMPPVFDSSDKEMQYYLEKKWLHPIDNDVPILTDDFAPVEYYSLLLTR